MRSTRNKSASMNIKLSSKAFRCSQRSRPSSSTAVKCLFIYAMSMFQLMKLTRIGSPLPIYESFIMKSDSTQARRAAPTHWTSSPSSTWWCLLFGKVAYHSHGSITALKESALLPIDSASCLLRAQVRKMEAAHRNSRVNSINSIAAAALLHPKSGPGLIGRSWWLSSSSWIHQFQPRRSSPIFGWSWLMKEKAKWSIPRSSRP